MSVFNWNTGNRVIGSDQFMGFGNVESNETSGQIINTFTLASANLTNLYVKTSANCTATFTVRVNGISTSLVVNLSGTNSGNNSNTVATVAGDLISVLVTNVTGEVSAAVCLLFDTIPA